MPSIKDFRGGSTGYNPRDIPENHSAGTVNAIVENGDISARSGYGKLRDPQSGFSAVYGADYVQGYSSGTEKEEIITVETVSASTKAYTNSATAGTATELTNGGSGVTLHASEWVTQAFRENAFLINPNNSPPVLRHAINTNNSLTPIAIPADPTVAPTYIVKYGPGGQTTYEQISFAGIDVATEITYSGAATATGSSLQSDNSLSIRHTNNKQESSFEVDLNGSTGGVLDFTYRDRFAFSLTCETSSFNIDPGSIRVEYRNNDGSPKTLIPSEIKKEINSVRPAGTSGNSYAIFFAYNDKTRADFDNIRYFKVYYTVVSASSTVANNDLIVSKPYIGGIYMWQSPPDRTPGSGGLYLAYTYYFSTPAFESGFSPVLFVQNSVLIGTSPYSGLPELGVTLEITGTVSGDSNVDNFRFYVQDNIDLVFRRLATQADSDATYDVRLSYPEIHRLDEFQPGPFIFASVINMCSHKGSVVWLYDTEFQNVRYSRVGDPLRQASNEDSEEDLDRGATFSLADNYADKPLGAVSVGDAVMIAGKAGVYFQLGDYPAQMTPSRKAAGSFGVAGKRAFDRWKDDSGLTGMVYVSPNGQVYFAVPGNGQNDGDNICISEQIREGDMSLKSWLLDGQASLGFTDFSQVQVRVNQRDDTLVIVMGQRGLKLRRPDLTGKRTWEACDWNTGTETATIKFLTASSKYGIRWVRSTGQIDEDEYSNTARQYIRGAKRDGGNPMPIGYWRSKVFAGNNRHIRRVYLQRSRMNEAARVRVKSLRLNQIYKIQIGKLFCNCAPLQQGFEHQFEIEVPETDAKYSMFTWEEMGLGRRTNL